MARMIAGAVKNIINSNVLMVVFMATGFGYWLLVIGCWLLVSSGIKERNVEFDEIKLQPYPIKTVADFCQKKKWWIP